MSLALTGRLPGTMPPTSSWWPNTWEKPMRRSPLKMGTVVHRSGMWPMPPQLLYGSFQKNTSPGWMSSASKYSKTGSTSAE